MLSIRQNYDWNYSSDDPNDETFSDIVETINPDSLEDYSKVLLGEPYDGGVIGRKGARKGPEALRKQLARTKTHHFGSGAVRDVADLGDIVIPDQEILEVQERMEELTSSIHYSSALPVFLGGGNSVTVPNVAPLLEDSVGVVSFDAHLDCREVIEDPSSGTPYRQLFDRGLDTLVVVGARHFETSTSYAHYLEEKGGQIIDAHTAGSSIEDTLENILAHLEGVESVYVSLDMDVLSSAEAPGVSAPTPGGLTSRELYELLFRLGSSEERISGFEVVECAPPLDTGERTSKAGSRAIAHMISGLEADRDV